MGVVPRVWFHGCSSTGVVPLGVVPLCMHTINSPTPCSIELGISEMRFITTIVKHSHAICVCIPQLVHSAPFLLSTPTPTNSGYIVWADIMICIPKLILCRIIPVVYQ